MPALPLTSSAVWQGPDQQGDSWEAGVLIYADDTNTRQGHWVCEVHSRYFARLAAHTDLEGLHNAQATPHGLLMRLSLSKGAAAAGVGEAGGGVGIRRAECLVALQCRLAITVLDWAMHGRHEGGAVQSTSIFASSIRTEQNACF